MTGVSDWIVTQRRGRVIRGALANLYALALKILLQVGQVPLFLHVWGAEQFGEWLLMTSIPTYLALSGLGFGTAAGNAISRLSASGDALAVRAILRAAWVVLTIASLTACAGVVLFCAVVDVPDFLGLHWLAGGAFTRILVLLCALVLVRMQFGLAESAFRATGRYPSFVMLDNTCQLLEFVAAALALIVVGTAEAVVIGMLLARLAGLLGAVRYIARRHSWILFGPAAPLRPWLRSLIAPSFGFVIMPISQSLSLQGTLLVAGHAFGPTAAAVLSTARTLARLVETALGLIYNLVYVEVGYAAGAADHAGLKRIMAWTTAASTLAGGVLSAGLLAFGPLIYRYWTHGKIDLDFGVLGMVLLAGVVRAFSTPAAAILAGLNQHSRYAMVLFASTSVSLMLAVAIRNTGLVGIAAASILMEVLVAAYAVPRGLAAAGLSLPEMLEILKDPAGLRRLAQRLGRGRRPAA